MSKPAKDETFDASKLMQMHEPLTLRVEKIRQGNQRQPIELPPKSEGSAPGTGWTRDEVLKLENWLLNEWSGGGYYVVTVTDAKGSGMTWSFVYDPRLYPERIPPNQAGAASIPNAPAPQAPQPMLPQMPTAVGPLGSTTSSFPPPIAAFGQNYGTFPPQVVSAPQNQPQPQMVFMPQQPQQPQQPWNGWGQPPAQTAPGFGSFQAQPSIFNRGDDEWDPMYRRRSWSGPAGMMALNQQQRGPDPEKQEMERRQHALEEQLRRAELSQKDMEYKATLERIQAEQARQLDESRRQAAEQLRIIQEKSAEQLRSLQEEMRRQAEAARPREDDEVRRLREENARIVQQMQQQQAQQQLAAQMQQMQQAHEQQMAMLREQIARMAEKPGESEELRRLRETQERQQRDMEQRMEQQRQVAEREREKYERDREQERLRAEMKEQREAFERQVAAQSMNRADPVVEALKENARLQAESMREMSRMQQANTDRMSAFMVSPVQLAQTIKDSSSGADHVTRTMLDAVGGIMNTYRQAFHQITELSGGGGEPPATRLIQEGMSRASEIAEKYLTVQRDKTVSENKVRQSQANAEAMRAQAQAQHAAAVRAQQNAYAQAAAAQQAQAARGPQGSGLGGVQPEFTTQSGHVGPEHQQPPQQPASAPAEVGPDGQPLARIIPMQRPPVTEEEMFGVSLESIKRLRKGVEEGKLDPSQTVDAILQGVNYVMSNRLVIPAFSLFEQERFPDFVDVLLPKVPQPFKDQVVQILSEEVETAASGGGGDDDDDGDGAA